MSSLLAIGLAIAIDGDTLNVAGTHVRLQGVAAPELSEPGGLEAKAWMAALLAGREVRCNLTGERSYERWVGLCFVGGSDVGEAIIRAGLARDCPRYSHGRYAGDDTEAGRRLPFPGYCRR